MAGSNLNDEQRAAAVVMWKSSVSVRDIAHHFSVNVSTVYRVVNRYKRTGTADKKKPPGRPTKLSERFFIHSFIQIQVYSK